MVLCLRKVTGMNEKEIWSKGQIGFAMFSTFMLGIVVGMIISYGV